MADDTSAVQLVTTQRERAARTSLVANARLGADYQSQQSAGGGSYEGDESGYWNGDTFVSFFTFGVSLFGDGSVLA